MKTATVEYRVGDKRFVGYLAVDGSNTAPRPGVLVLPEWWGLTEHARERAERLVGLGYNALAVDLYGEGVVAETPDRAGELCTEVMSNVGGVGMARLLAARAALAGADGTDGGRIGVIGFCFGGTLALHAARRGADFGAFVSFHGSYETGEKAQAGQARGPVLVCDGAADQLRTPESLEAMANEFAAAGVDLKVIAYPGAQHAFTNPAADANARKFGLPLAYNEAADRASWADMTDFLARTL